MELNVIRTFNRALAGICIPGMDRTGDREVRVRHGIVAGWISVLSIVVLFVVKLVLGLVSGSISLVGAAFHLFSHLANSVILLITFWVSSRPATSRTPFGHGRMEYLAPLLMSVFLLVTGLQIGERSIHQALDPHPVYYWPGLIWILAATIVIRIWLGQFVEFLGHRVHSPAILTAGHHHRLDAVLVSAVLAGLIIGHHFDRPEVDGYMGAVVSAWLLFVGYRHAKHAAVPLMGQAPSPDLIRRIRELARSVQGVEDVHGIIVHDYGSMQLISLHVEIPEHLGPAAMHEIVEQCETALRRVFGGEVVCHTDPLLEKTEEVRAIQERFDGVVEELPEVIGYHDFRVIADSPTRVLIVADIDLADEVPESEFGRFADELERRVKRVLPSVAYCSFYVTPKYVY